MAEQLILDASCGPKMFWFNRDHPDVTFMDRRAESLAFDTRAGRRAIVVDPDVVADFTSMPFPDEHFSLVVFDPPHLTRNGASGWMRKKYGVLDGDWPAMLKRGFAECFRVLKPGGVLVFKWNSLDVSVEKILRLTPVPPLIGNRCGKAAKSHWILFLKS